MSAVARRRGAGVSGPAVDTSVITDLENFRVFSSPCYARVKCDNDGDWYESNNAGSYSAAEGTWLTSGLNSEVWIERTIDSGTLTTDAGSGRLACSVDRVFDVQRSTFGAKTCTLTFEFWDAASGGNSLGTKQIVLTANWEDGSE